MSSSINKKYILRGRCFNIMFGAAFQLLYDCVCWCVLFCVQGVVVRLCVISC